MARAALITVREDDCPEDADVSALPVAESVDVRVARWTAPAGRATRGTVFLCHGYSEFIEKYYEVIRDLRDRGYAVATFDWRGQGLSTRPLPNRQKAHVDSFDHFVSDSLAVFHRLVEGEMPGPYLLMAHSMGGNIALRILQEAPGLFQRAVLSAPMTGWLPFPYQLTRMIARLHVALGYGQSYAWGRGDADLENRVNRVTSDQARFQRERELWCREPDLIVGGVTWQWVCEAAASIRLVMDPARIARIEAPTLLATAGKDYLVSSATHSELARHNPRITLKAFPEAMHEILQETDAIRDRFWRAYDSFVEGTS